MRGIVLVAAVGLALGATACGTTVPQASSGGASVGGTGLGTEPASASTSLGGDVGFEAGGSTGGAGSAGGSGSAGGAAAGSAGGEVPRAAGSVTARRGGSSPPAAADRKPIEIGFYVLSAKSDQTLQSLGYSNLSVGNGVEAAKAIVNDINARGGIAGRKLIARIAERDLTSSSSFDAMDQEACAFFFEDNRVAAVVNTARVAGPMLQCTQKHQVPLLNGTGLDDLTVEGHQRYPQVVTPAGIDLDRLQRPYIDGLFGQNFFTPWNATSAAPGSAPVKIGLLYTNRPYQDSVISRSMEPALKVHGLSIIDRVQIADPQSTSDLGSQAAAVQNAVLKFRNDGITHVLFIDPNGSLALLFASSADSQRYYPRFGMTSIQKPSAQQGTAPSKSLAGALGVGWNQLLDVDQAGDPGSNTAFKRCKAIFDKARVDTSKRSASAILAGICDGAFSLQSAWQASGQLSTAGYFAGLAKVGSRFESTMTFASNPAIPTHSGALAVRNFAWDAPCTCFRYRGPVRSIN